MKKLNNLDALRKAVEEFLQFTGDNQFIYFNRDRDAAKKKVIDLLLKLYK
jgi:hypothetical protein